jgi:hypothetical protein
MTVRVSIQDRLRDLINHHRLCFSDCIEAFKDDDWNPDSHVTKTIMAAKRKSEEGAIEVDDTTIISESSDKEGAYVMAWMWVSNEEADITEEDWR